MSLAAALAGGCTEPLLPRPSDPCPEQQVDDGQAERVTFELVNAERVQRSLPPFQWDDLLADIARRYSRTLADADLGLTHANFSKRRNAAYMRLGVTRVAENLALSCGDAQSGPQLAVSAWLASPSHRAALLKGFPISGIGVAQSHSGYLYITELFAGPR